ncbi:hypothetical protein FRC00_007020 [Tulasnella sp. 408]|nr:hypothetical protein FRC00_007020 [Tulasnella sp. 408]
MVALTLPFVPFSVLLPLPSRYVLLLSFAAFANRLAEDIRVPTQKEPTTTSGTGERLIDPDIGGKTAASTAVTLDVKATGGTDEPRETSTELTKPVVEPAGRAETVPHAVTVYVATTDATSAPVLALPPAGNVSPGTANAILATCATVELDLGVANVTASVKERIVITNIPASTTWAGGRAGNFVLDYDRAL